MIEPVTIRVVWRCLDCALEEVEENAQRYLRFAPERARLNVRYDARAQSCAHVRRVTQDGMPA